MQTNTKYMLSGAIIATVGSIYALQKNIDSDLVYEKIKEHKEKFDQLITELVKITVEVLERILKTLKKFFMELIFKFKMALNI